LGQDGAAQNLTSLIAPFSCDKFAGVCDDLTEPNAEAFVCARWDAVLLGDTVADLASNGRAHHDELRALEGEGPLAGDIGKCDLPPGLADQSFPVDGAAIWGWLKGCDDGPQQDPPGSPFETDEQPGPQQDEPGNPFDTAEAPGASGNVPEYMRPGSIWNLWECIKEPGDDAQCDEYCREVLNDPDGGEAVGGEYLGGACGMLNCSCVNADCIGTLNGDCGIPDLAGPGPFYP
jgi:hypothetical protein